MAGYGEVVVGGRVVLAVGFAVLLSAVLAVDGSAAVGVSEPYVDSGNAHEVPLQPDYLGTPNVGLWEPPAGYGTGWVYPMVGPQGERVVLTTPAEAGAIYPMRAFAIRDDNSSVELSLPEGWESVNGGPYAFSVAFSTNGKVFLEVVEARTFGLSGVVAVDLGSGELLWHQEMGRSGGGLWLSVGGDGAVYVFYEGGTGLGSDYAYILDGATGAVIDQCVDSGCVNHGALRHSIVPTSTGVATFGTGDVQYFDGSLVPAVATASSVGPYSFGGFTQANTAVVVSYPHSAPNPAPCDQNLEWIDRTGIVRTMPIDTPPLDDCYSYFGMAPLADGGVVVANVDTDDRVLRWFDSTGNLSSTHSLVADLGFAFVSAPDSQLVVDENGAVLATRHYSTTEICPSGLCQYAELLVVFPDGSSQVIHREEGRTRNIYISSVALAGGTVTIQLQGTLYVGSVSTTIDYVQTVVAPSLGDSYQRSRYFAEASGGSVRTPLRIAALGDSFSSGEGAGYVGFWSSAYYLPGTATKDNSCHRSYTAYGQLIRKDLGTTDIDFLFAACSGAVTDDVLERLQYPNSPDGVPGNLAQWVELSLFDDPLDPVDVVLIGIGGNDVGFADTLTRCVANASCELGAVADATENTIDAAFRRLVDTYLQVKEGAPDAEVYVFGYPQFLNPLAACTAASGLGAGERMWMRRRLTQMNDVIELATRAAGVHFVDVEDAFEPDGLICGPDPLTHGIIEHAKVLFWNGPVRVESFHPTARGHTALRSEFFSQYPLSSVGSNPNPDPVFVEAPVVDGITASFGSMTVSSAGVARTQGDEVWVTIPGLEPGSTVIVGTYSDYQEYGRFVADTSGIAAFSYVVPEDLENGLHTIEGIGTDPDGNLLIASGAYLLMDPGGTFSDDDGSIHEPAIEGIAYVGVTKGCNPPANNHFCPSSPVTRGQMAAFLTRALGLTDDGGGNSFVDDDGSVFEGDIAKLAAAGITKGCNPPVNDHFCPSSSVTRGQMAAFLVRALGLADDGGGNSFVDDDGSVFEGDIAKLAAAGITKGCNPPTNDRYCPDSLVTRAQMATFLVRALDLGTIQPPTP